MTIMNRKANAVAQDAAVHQRLLDTAAQADAHEGIRQGMDDVKEGRVRPAREFFSDFEKRYGIRRYSLPENSRLGLER